MKILESSKLIKNIFLNNNVNTETDTNINYIKEAEILFDEFKINKNILISFQTIINFIKKFEIISISENIFTNIANTKIDNYFCLKHNKMLITSFIILFFKIDNDNYNITQINNKFIFDFFVGLGEFFNYMDFLDVDNIFLYNLKSIITLYTLQLNRKVIEKHFHYNIEILDIFFSNEIIPNVFLEVNFNNLRTYKKYINKFKLKYKKEYNEDIETNIKNYVSSNDLIIINNILEKIPIKKNNNIQNEKEFKYDIYNDIYENNSNETSETIIDIIEKDIKFYELFNCKNDYLNTIDIKERHKYIKILILKYYQKITEKYESYIKNIRKLCLGIKINDYSKFKPNIKKTIVLLHIQTFIGIMPNIETIIKYFKEEKKDTFILNNIMNDLIMCSCRLGYFNLFKQCIDLYKHSIYIDVLMFYMITHANSIIPNEFNNYLKEIKFQNTNEINNVI
jgi:hypothetical protein